MRSSESQAAKWCGGIDVELVSLDAYEGRWFGGLVMKIRFIDTGNICNAMAMDIVPVGGLAKAMLREARR